MILIWLITTTAILFYYFGVIEKLTKISSQYDTSKALKIVLIERFKISHWRNIKSFAQMIRLSNQRLP